MQLSRKITIVAATFLLAAATGQYMQSTTHKAPRTAAKPVSGQASGGAAQQPRQSVSLGIPGQVTPLAATPVTKAQTGALAAPVTPVPAAGKAMADAKAPGCHARARITVDDGAILHLRLDAPCHADQRVVVRHGGLAFTELTDAKGKLDVRLPAMTETAKVTVMFPGDSTVSASTLVPELSLYDRVAVQWVGQDRFDLHALEFGAKFGEKGDISAANPGTPTPATTATEGFLMTLGDSNVTLPMKAQVYTFPSRLSARDGTIRLVIDADVSADTCGREMLAETLRSRRDADPATQDLSVAMPACDAPGGVDGFVQLSGLMPDITVAEQ